MSDIVEFYLDFEWDKESLDVAFKELETECEQVIRGLTVDIYYSILHRTPQHHGRMAASWTYTIGTPLFLDRSHLVPEPTDQGRFGHPYIIMDGEKEYLYDEAQIFMGWSKGHMEAISISNSANAGADSHYRLGDNVFISNGVDHGEGPYSEAVEKGEIKLRPENLPGAPVRLSIEQAERRFSNDISTNFAESFKLKTIY